MKTITVTRGEKSKQLTRRDITEALKRCDAAALVTREGSAQMADLGRFTRTQLTTLLTQFDRDEVAA